MSTSSSVSEIHPPQRFGAEEWDLRVQLAAAYRLTHHFGWDFLIYNHISLRVPGPERHFLINPFGLRYDEITASNLVKIGLDGNLVDTVDASVNRGGFVIHSAVHAAREDLHCIMHTHTRAGVAVSSLEAGLQFWNQDSMFFYDRVAYHDYEGLALDTDECERVVADLGGKQIMILRNHGLLTMGRTVAEAFIWMYFLETACQKQIDILAANSPVRQPSDDMCRRVADQFTSFGAGRKKGEGFGEREFSALVRMLDEKDPSYRQ